MFIKKDLLATPPVDIQPGMSFDEGAHYALTATIREGSPKILEIDIWAGPMSENKGLCARVFFARGEQRYITYFIGEVKHTRGNRVSTFSFVPADDSRWSGASIEKLFNIKGVAHLGFCYCYRIACVEEKIGYAIKKYFHSYEKHPLDTVLDYQRDLMDKALVKRNKAKRDAVHSIMCQVSELPEDWEDFIQNGALRFSRYIIYERVGKKKIVGYCTHCQNLVVLENAHHNAPGICPSCHSAVITKSHGITSWIRDWGRCSYIQKLQDGSFLLRLFEVYRTFEKGLRSHKDSYYESRRYHIRANGTVVMYDKYDADWRTRVTLDRYANILYPSNVKAVLADTDFRYCAADAMADAYKPFSVVGWLQRYHELRQIEYLPKLKLYNFSCSVSLYDNKVKIKDGSNIKECLPFSKEDIQVFAAVDAADYEIYAYMRYKDGGYFLSGERMLEFRRKNENPMLYLTDMAPNVDPFKLFRYIGKQTKSQFPQKDALRFWKDYMRMAIAEDYDLNDEYYIFPPRLKDLHDEVNELRLMKTANDQLKRFGMDVQARFIELAAEYAAFSWSDGTYSIHVPESLQELITNGTMLKICVANPENGYIKAYCTQAKLLFALQRVDSPGKPYVIFEMRPDGGVGQVSTTRNEHPPEQVREAIAVWKKTIVMPELRRRKHQKRVMVAV